MAGRSEIDENAGGESDENAAFNVEAVGCTDDSESDEKATGRTEFDGNVTGDLDKNLAGGLIADDSEFDEASGDLNKNYAGGLIADELSRHVVCFARY